MFTHEEVICSMCLIWSVAAGCQQEGVGLKDATLAGLSVK